MSFAAQRALKVINFSLGSKKCAEEGYIVDPKPPRDDLINYSDHFQMEDPSTARDTHRMPKAAVFKQCFYHNSDKLFYALFQDGSGTVYYESGRPAVVIASNTQRSKSGVAIPATPRKLHYVILTDDSRQNVVGLFLPDGNAACYFADRNLRLHMDPCGGILFGSDCEKKKSWSWLEFIEQHQHAPPMQSMSLILAPFISLKVTDQEHMSLVFRHASNSVKFNVGVRLKLTGGKGQLPKLLEKSNDVVYLADMKTYTQAVMDKIQNLLKYKNESHAEKLPPPPYIVHQLEKRNITSAPKWGVRKSAVLGDKLRDGASKFQPPSNTAAT
jgi:hypothetical protein